MTLIDCATPEQPLTVAPVTKNTAWQARLRAAALNQKTLAAMLGIAENTMSRQMKGDWPVAGYVVAFVEAWEIMTAEQRAEWTARRERESKRKP
jgi:hypothetical protein